MISTSDKYKSDKYNAEQNINGILTLSNGTSVTLSNDNILQNSLTFRESAVNGGFGVGGVIANQIDIALFLDLYNPFLLSSASIDLSAKYKFDDDTSQAIPIGTFYVDDGSVERGRTTVSFTAYDGMILFDKPIGKNTAFKYLTPYKLIKAACDACGVVCGTYETAINAMPNGTRTFVWEKQEQSYTYRDLLAYTLQIIGAFGRINRSTKKFEVVRFSDTSDFSINEDNAIKRNVSDTKVSVMGAKYEDTIVGGDTFAIDLSGNPLLENASDTLRKNVLTSLKESDLKNIEFYNADVTWFGDLSVQAGDCFTYEQDGLYGGSRKIIVMESEWKPSGSCTIKSYGDNSQNAYSPISKIALAHAETLAYIKANYILANTVETQYLKAETAELTYATIDNLNAANADIKNLTTDYADIKKLHTGDMTAVNADIKKLDANVADINELVATKADISQLSAINADIKKLSAGVADIDTLIFGSATGTTIQTDFSNAVIAQLGDAQILSAMIDSLSANKITAGNIYTNAVRVYGDDTNKLSIVDNTISISDGTQIRVQIGKDANNDYNMYVWDSSGNLMFDALGVTYNGIKRPVIRDDVVSDNANISANKLNIDSLFSAINEDGTHTLQSSKIYVDADNQTLDVSFKNMTDSVNENSKAISSQGTDISVIQGQISSKIWQQDIDDVSSEMSTKYSEISQTLNDVKVELGSSISNMQEQLDGSTGAWTGNDVPTLDNYPASDWVANGELNRHVGNMYYDQNGYSYRFMASGVYTDKGVALTDENNNMLCNYYWLAIKDSEVSKALQNAQEALSRVDGLNNILLNNYSTTVDMNSAIEMSKESITQTVSKTYSTKSDVVEKVASANQHSDDNLLAAQKDASDKANKALSDAKKYTGDKLADYSTTTQMNSAIQQKADKITQTVSETRTYLIKYTDKAKTDALTDAKSDMDNKLKSYSTTAQMNSAIDQKSNEITQTVSNTYTTKEEYGKFEVGGRNLIINSIDLVGDMHYFYNYALTDDSAVLTYSDRYLVI